MNHFLPLWAKKRKEKGLERDVCAEKVPDLYCRDQQTDKPTHQQTNKPTEIESFPADFGEKRTEKRGQIAGGASKKRFEVDIYWKRKEIEAFPADLEEQKTEKGRGEGRLC